MQGTMESAVLFVAIYDVNPLRGPVVSLTLFRLKSPLPIAIK
jgi:hypothetical protein